MTLQDFNWVVFSVIWVVGFIIYHTQSVMLACAAMLQIILCFPVAFFIYRLILQVDFFNFLSILTVFVILGIGADDIFVFVDAWKQSACENPSISSSTLARMDWTWRRAASAMFVTSLTAAVAFFATAVSRIMPIAAFGLYAGTTVVANYLCVITFFPVVVRLWHRHLEHKPMCFGACGCWSALR